MSINRFLKRSIALPIRAVRDHIRVLADGSRWIIRPSGLEGRKVCVLATFSADGRVPEHALELSRSWQAMDYATILVMSCADLKSVRVDRATTSGLAGFLVRKNIGYDFGSWSAAIRQCPWLRNVALLALANDSVYGPLDGFATLLERVDQSPADVIGMTDSFQSVHHLQSYLVFYKPTALRNAIFRTFWLRPRLGGRDEVIRTGELTLMFEMKMAGLRVDALFEAPRSPVENPMLNRWRSLVEAGLPFVKIQLLRDNPLDVDLNGWDRFMDSYHYPASRVNDHLGQKYPDSAAARSMLKNSGVGGDDQAQR